METRETLREFSLNVVNAKGNEFRIEYGYDLSKSTPMYYVRASIDGKPMASTKSVLKRVRSLGIEPINNLIDLIGCDETGVALDFDSQALTLLMDYYALRNSSCTDRIASFLRITDDKGLRKLEDILSKLVDMDSQGKSEKVIRGAYMRYLNSQRLRMLMEVRETAQALRKMFYKGVEVSGAHSTVKLEGYLKQNHYPTYYKRDIDLIRASRVRIYKEVLKREYVPVQD